MSKKKRVITMVSIAVVSFLIGTTLNVMTMATDGGNPFDNIWEAIYELQSRTDSLNASLTSRIESLEGQISDLQTAIEMLQRRTDDLNTSLTDLQDRVSTIEEKSNQVKMIKFVAPSESMVSEDVYKDAATFIWTPSDSSNNAILSVAYYAEYKARISPDFDTMEPKWRTSVNGKVNWGHGPYLYDDITSYTWTPLYSWAYRGQWDPGNRLGGGIEPNQASYTIKFQIAAERGSAYFRNINVILTVTDGMPPM